MDSLPATSWSKINDEAFHNVFGMYGVAFLGSTIACYVAQTADVLIYLSIRKLTGLKHLWIRNIGSTAISLLIDTTLVITFLTIFDIIPYQNMLELILNSYSWKLFFTIFMAPLFYLSVSIMRKYLL